MGRFDSSESPSDSPRAECSPSGSRREVHDAALEALVDEVAVGRI
jgi:hypothetical protein